LNEEAVEAAHSWVGVGKEIGTAINDGLMATVDAADKFSQTDIGFYTMVIIAWKFLGEDAIEILVNLIVAFIFFPALFWSYWRNCVTRRIVISKTKESTEYKVLNSLEESRKGYSIGSGDICPLSFSRLMHAVMALILLFVILV